MNYINPIPVTCNCGNPHVKPQLHEFRSNGNIITEARYVCPRCSSYFKRGTVSSKPDPAVKPAAK